MRVVLHTVLSALLVANSISICHAGDWHQFRGPGGLGVSDETNVPTSWDSNKNVRWRVELPGPGNNGSPIVSKDCVFLAVATEDGRKRSLHCYDRNTGKKRWVRTVPFDEKEPTHKTSLYAASTPVADGTRVVVWHSSAGMYCYDYEGKELWAADLGSFIHIWGYGASPIIHGDLVINNCGPGERTFLVALNKHSGEVVWQTDEPGGKSDDSKPWIGSWSTPVVADVNGQDQILVSYPFHVKAYDPATGKVLWQCDGLTELAYTSVVVAEDRAVAMGGFRGPAIGFNLGGKGNVTEQNTLWRVEKNPQRIGSGIILGDVMFMANEEGIVECLDVATGKQRWEERLPEGGKVWGSLTYAGDCLYVTNQKGNTTVFAANPDKFEVLSTNPLEEHTNSTIAISDGQIFLRTFEALYCIDE
jgi:outer membrane protein assembly factor BamB